MAGMTSNDDGSVIAVLCQAFPPTGCRDAKGAPIMVNGAFEPNLCKIPSHGRTIAALVLQYLS